MTQHLQHPPTLDKTPQFSTSIKKTIYCQNSGLPLANLEVTIFEGHLPYVESFDNSIALHPFYKLSSRVLISKLESSLHQAQEQGWICSNAEQTRLRLLVSALMYSLDSLKQECSTLPSFPVASGSAGRLLGLAKWFYFISSQRLAFPIYSVSKKNENLQWENFKFWLDSAYEVRQAWSSQSKQLARNAQQRAYELSLKEIKSESILKRVDTKKVWNWIQIQLEGNYAEGRLVTFRSLFLDGDLNAHDWTADDVDDLIEALNEHCDLGNEIMFFIKKRLSGIRALIRDFYSSFTVINSNSDGGDFGSEEQTKQEQAFFSTFDDKVDQLEQMPSAPKREDFETLGKFLKAQAHWNILNKRFQQIKGKKEEGKAS